MQLQLYPSWKVPLHNVLCDCTIIRSVNRREEYLAPDRVRGEDLFSIPAIVTITDHELDTVLFRDKTKEGVVTLLSRRRAFYVHTDRGIRLERSEIPCSVRLDDNLVSFFVKDSQKRQELIPLQKRFTPGYAEAVAGEFSDLLENLFAGYISTTFTGIPGIAPGTVQVTAG